MDSREAMVWTFVLPLGDHTTSKGRVRVSGTMVMVRKLLWSDVG